MTLVLFELYEDHASNVRDAELISSNQEEKEVSGVI